ncbi:MAG TPA: PQQ-binding-like beta-propeller repeat protein [Kiritimatiellia bacterium]|nr:PQQ-binding-like beta-propeller repeat protein [Kiritimatiellia bacterium]
MVFAAGFACGDWPQLQFDGANRGFSSGQRIRTGVHADRTTSGGYGPESWGWTNRWLAGQPVVGNGKVIVGSMTNRVFALDETSGVLVWSTDVGAPVLNSCAVVDGRVVVATQGGTVWALSAVDGETIWSVSFSRHGFAAAPTVVGGRIFVGAKDGRFHGIDLETGSVVWSFEVGGSEDMGADRAAILCTAAVMDGRVFFGAENMHAYGLDTETGARIWRRGITGQSFVFGDPVGSNDERAGITFAAGWAVASEQHGGVVIFRTQPIYAPPWLLDSEETFLEQATGTNWMGNPLGTTNEWIVEQRAISQRLAGNPSRRTLWALEPATGEDKYSLPLPVLWTSGSGHAGTPPVVDDESGRAWVTLRTVYARLDSGSIVRPYGDLVNLHLDFDPAIYTNPSAGRLGFEPFPCAAPPDCIAVYGDVHKVSDEGEVLTGCANALISTTWVSDGGYDLESGQTFNVRYYSSDDLGGAPLYGAAAGAVLANGRVILRDTTGIKSYAAEP